MTRRLPGWPHRTLNRSHHRLPVLLLGTLTLALMPEPTVAGELQWIASPCECPSLESSSDGLEVIPCGALGHFYAWDPAAQKLTEAAESCPATASGQEEPRAYVAYPEVATTDPWLPCENGSCFGGTGADRVAILDWDDPHGWTVGATVLASADAPLAVDLHPLESSLVGLDAKATASVGDLHVLSALCRLAEEISAGGPPPLAVNMSFGRLEDGKTADCEPQGNSLPCQISRALTHLHDDLGITLVAAAGNHGELLFPARHPAVLAAGSLNLEWFHYTGGIAAEPAWQSPGGPDAVFQGHAVCLEKGDGSTVWRAPAGSSYASAVFAGWVAGCRAQGMLSPPVAGSWSPRDDGQGGYVVVDEKGDEMAFEAGGKLLTHSRSGSSHPCWKLPANSSPPAVMAVGSLATPGPTELLPSLPQRSRDENHPTPEADPCVPCYGGGGGGQGNKALMEESALSVDLSASAPLPGELEVVDVYVRIEGVTYHLETLEGDPLTGLTQGTLDTLVLEGVDPLALPGDQVSLVYELGWGEEPQHFWSSSPIHFPDGTAP